MKFFFEIFFEIFVVVVVAPDGVWMQGDLTLFKTPAGDLRKITWYANGKADPFSSRDGSVSKDPNNASPTSIRSDVRRRAARFLNRSSTTASNSTTTTDDPNMVAEIFFHRSVSDVLIAVYPRQIVLVSLRYLCPYRTIPLEKSGSDFFSVLPLRQRDGFFACIRMGR